MLQNVNVEGLVPALDSVRLALQQPAVPGYRVPVFRELSRRLGAPVRVFSAHDVRLPRASSEGFSVQDARAVELRLNPEHTLLWDTGQWAAAMLDDVDVVVFTWDLHYVSLVPALLAARARRRGTVIWGHGASRRETKLFQRARDGVARFADAVLFYDHATAAAFRERTDHPGVFVAQNSLDQRPMFDASAHWRSRETEALQLLEAHGVRRPYVLFVSRLYAENRLDVLLGAAAQLKQRGLVFDVVVIGEGPDRPRLEGLQRAMHLDDCVRFLGPVYGEQQLAPWFLHASVFCYPSNAGLSLHHAFGYGLPVVAGDDLARHCPEIRALRADYNGLLFRHDSPAALSRELSKVLADEGLRRKLSIGALQTATRDFTLERMIDGFEAAVQYAQGKRGR